MRQSVWFFVILHLLFYGTQSFAQSSGQAVDDADTFVTSLYLPKLKESDVLWSRRIFRVVDLGNKQNAPMKALAGLIFNGAKSGRLIPYRSVNCRDTMTFSEFLSAATFSMVRYELINPELGQENNDNVRVDTIIHTAEPNDVRKFILMEEWYRDKRSGEVHVSILAVAPVVKMQAVRAEEYEKPWAWFRFISQHVQEGELMFELIDKDIISGVGRCGYVAWFKKRMFTAKPLKRSNTFNLGINESEVYKDDVGATLTEADLIQLELMDVADDYWAH